MGKRLRIAINAQIKPNSGVGGIEAVLTALTALSRLDDGEEEYVFIGPWDEPEWLQPLLDSRQSIVRGPQPFEWKPGPLEPLKRALRPLRPVARGVWGSLFRSTSSETNMSGPVSDGFYESLNCEVIHFPFQFFVRCALPMIYNPHDLQHVHYPEFFEPSVFNSREAAYPAACHAAHTVAVASQFVKHDIVQHYGVDPDKIQVIPWAPPPIKTSPAFADDILVRKKYQLPDQPFALYPAMTWEHKNHIRLLEALALLRDRDELKVHLICTGDQKSFWPRIERRLLQLGLEEQVKFLGLVSHEELCAIYRAAQFVIIPTLFEAASAPLFEAWQHDVPVACSSITSLPEQAADAALLFNPLSVEAIADAAARMTTGSGLREDLRRRGARRLQDFSFERTAKTYRAVYRRAAGRILSEEDRWLLSWDWMRKPQRETEAQYQ